jgi:hypothetical protein
MDHPAIPVRTSSKRKGDAPKHSATSTAVAVTSEELQAQINKARDDEKAQEKIAKLVPKTSSEFWDEQVKLAQISMQKDQLKYRSEKRKFHDADPDGDYDTSAKGRDQKVRIKTWRSNIDLYQAQSKQIQESKSPIPQAIRASAVENFFQYKLETPTPAIGGQRPKDEARALRKKAIEVYAVHNPGSADYYDIITAVNHPDDSIITSHIFPKKFGLVDMTAFFGRGDELHSVRNVMMMSKAAERRFDKYLFCIVPTYTRNLAGILNWKRAKPTEYKIKVMEPKSSLMQEKVFGLGDTKWVDLDGKILEWKSDARPRRRYLWFHYACAQVKLGRLDDKGDLPNRREEVYWGTMGKWFKSTLLAGVAEALGNQWEEIAESFDVDDEDESGQNNARDYSLGMAMNAAVMGSTDETNEDDNEDDELEGDDEQPDVTGEED